jgi:hypothetical protein
MRRLLGFGQVAGDGSSDEDPGQWLTHRSLLRERRLQYSGALFRIKSFSRTQFTCTFSRSAGRGEADSIGTVERCLVLNPYDLQSKDPGDLLNVFRDVTDS